MIEDSKELQIQRESASKLGQFSGLGGKKTRDKKIWEW
jgi:hypothetical protein